MFRALLISALSLLPNLLAGQTPEGDLAEAARILPGTWTGQCGPDVTLHYTFETPNSYRLLYELLAMLPDGRRSRQQSSIRGTYQLMEASGRGTWTNPNKSDDFVGKAISLRLHPNGLNTSSIVAFSHNCQSLLTSVIDARVGFFQFNPQPNQDFLELRGSDDKSDFPILFQRQEGRSLIRPVAVDPVRPELQTQALGVFRGAWRIRHIRPVGNDRVELVDTNTDRSILTIRENSTYEVVGPFANNHQKETGTISFQEVEPDRSHSFFGLKLNWGPPVKATFRATDGTMTGRVSLIGDQPWGTPIDMLHYLDDRGFLIDFYPATAEERLFH